MLNSDVDYSSGGSLTAFNSFGLEDVGTLSQSGSLTIDSNTEIYNDSGFLTFGDSSDAENNVTLPVPVDTYVCVSESDEGNGYGSWTSSYNSTDIQNPIAEDQSTYNDFGETEYTESDSLTYAAPHADLIGISSTAGPFDAQDIYSVAEEASISQTDTDYGSTFNVWDLYANETNYSDSDSLSLLTPFLGTSDWTYEFGYTQSDPLKYITSDYPAGSTSYTTGDTGTFFNSGINLDFLSANPNAATRTRGARGLSANANAVRREKPGGRCPP